jgi:hypothetical protein
LGGETLASPRIEDLEREVRERALQAAARDLELADRALIHVNHGLVPISGQKRGYGARLVRLLAVTGAFNSLRWAKEVAVCGYPPESLTLVRAALERWGTAKYVEKHPGEAYRWLTASDNREDWPPRFDRIWAEMEDDIKDTAKSAYGVLSEFAHPRAGGLPHLVDWDEALTYFHLGPHWDQDAFEACLYFVLTVTQLFYRVVGNLQVECLGSVSEEWGEKALQLTDEMAAYVDRHAANVLARLRVRTDPDRRTP